MWNKNKNTKTCSKCKEVLPATKEYFFVKTMKYKLTNGTEKQVRCLRYICRKCQSDIVLTKQRTKRCKELGISINDYEKWKKENMGKTLGNQKYKFINQFDISESEKVNIKNEIRKGYKFITLQKYRKDRKNMRLERYKKAQKERCNTAGFTIYNDLPSEYNFYKDIPNELRKKIIKKRPANDAHLANWLGLSIKNAPQELLDTKRVIVHLNRFIRNN